MSQPPAPRFSVLLTDLSQVSENEFSLNVPASWMQGRTIYGGLSAAICLQAVETAHPLLPPLRSAQINFVGPASGNVHIDTEIMRAGRSVTYISAKMTSEKGLATHAVFCFGTTRESRLNHHFTDKPNVPDLANSTDLFQSSKAPAFTQHYECKLAQGGFPISGSEQHEQYLWVRHKDHQANGMPALLGIADMAPPAVLAMFKELAPVSSMNWMLNFLTNDLTTKDGWWLLRSTAEHAHNGYSSQTMQVWNSNGELISSAIQNVAIFY